MKKLILLFFLLSSILIGCSKTSKLVDITSLSDDEISHKIWLVLADADKTNQLKNIPLEQIHVTFLRRGTIGGLVGLNDAPQQNREPSYLVKIEYPDLIRKNGYYNNALVLFYTSNNQTKHVVQYEDMKWYGHPTSSRTRAFMLMLDFRDN
jgi:hypothetical protein